MLYLWALNMKIASGMSKLAATLRPEEDVLPLSPLHFDQFVRPHSCLARKAATIHAVRWGEDGLWKGK